MANVPKTKAPVLRYVDRPEVSETFADSIESSFFDGNTLRIEFTVTRFDEPKPPAAPTGRKYPAARLVLSQAGTLDLINKIFNLRAVLIQHGILTEGGAPTNPPPQQPLH
jgi:hypothetical protein